MDGFSSVLFSNVNMRNVTSAKSVVGLLLQYTEQESDFGLVKKAEKRVFADPGDFSSVNSRFMDSRSAIDYGTWHKLLIPQSIADLGMEICLRRMPMRVRIFSRVERNGVLTGGNLGMPKPAPCYFDTE
ncbi:MAG TPA: hypothetical protein ENI99_03200 [Sedimenticola sp.]|nr:hypothetical protein [Sedimenticola sp.]